MIVQIEVPKYEGRGLRFVWEDDFCIKTEAHHEGHDYVFIRANAPGLVSLARHFLLLAQSTVPTGFHFHLDDSNSLEDGSVELIVEKLE